jgi:hypothetical protein
MKDKNTKNAPSTKPATCDLQPATSSTECGRSATASTSEAAPPPRYALRRDLGFWQLTFNYEPAILKHEQGIFYVAWLLHNRPEEPIHGVALALEVRALYGKPIDEAQIVQQRAMGLDDAETFRALRQKQKELEAIVDDRDEIEPVRAEAMRELQEIYEFQRRSPWRTRDCAQKTVRAVSMAIRRFRQHLAAGTTANGGQHAVLCAFGRHLDRYLVVPSARGGYDRPRFADLLAGCFGYRSPVGVVWQ